MGFIRIFALLQTIPPIDRLTDMSGLRPQDKDTICALATPLGRSALAVIRVSGSQALKISQKLCPFLSQPSLPCVSHRLRLGSLINPTTKAFVDEVLVSYFKKGRSFTGEETVEIFCHGSVLISSLILEFLVHQGARMSERGEFSYRAFMNGKIDLIQAESILNLIHSRSKKAHTQALRGMKGVLSEWLKEIEQDLLVLISHIEAGIDFSDQVDSLIDVEKQKQILKKIKNRVQRGLKKVHQGQINQNGFVVVLLGATNAGKSSLFNQLIQEKQAIVTSQPGTTRDVLSSRIIWGEREFCLKDTAGLRKNPGEIEKQGIKKALEESQKADLNLFLIEGHSFLKRGAFVGFNQLDRDKTIFVFSKSDLLSEKDKKSFTKSFYASEEYKKGFLKNPLATIWVSSLTGHGVDHLKKLIYQKSEEYSGDDFFSTIRQMKGLQQINQFLTQAEQLLQKQDSLDLVAFELQSALKKLYELLGKEYNEEILKEVFKNFCIGK